MKKRQLAILGSTGSIGTQALEVVSEHSDLFEVYALTANNQVDLLINQARKYMPEVVVIANERKYPELKEALEDLPIKVWAGADAIAQMVQSEPIDMVLTAMVGYSGLRPTISAIKAGKAIALANKETLVVAGELIMKLAAEHKVPILPVDSEHSAIFQCLTGAYDNPIEKILLTASGGPFRQKTLEELATVTKAQALRHPNWTMGAKITIDSASMMNKGFEMIEAKWLFDVTPDQVQVVVHPQSVIHSMVQFEDGAVIEEPDMERFRNLAFAFEAARQGGNIPCILNAANEVVVAAFLQDRIGFLQMSDVIEQTMRKASFIVNPSYEDYVATDTEARRLAAELF